jgi:hypothetical protein
VKKTAACLRHLSSRRQDRRELLAWATCIFVIDVWVLPACKSNIVEHVYILMQEITATMYVLTTPGARAMPCSLFSENPLRVFQWIRYDSGLFGRDDKRQRDINELRVPGA